MLTDRPDNIREMSAESPSSVSSGHLEQLQHLDKGAWDRFVCLYYPMIYQWCRHAGMQPADSCDICQEVFRGIFCSLGNFSRAEPSSTFRGWIRVIWKKRICDHHRKRRAESHGGEGFQILINSLSDQATDATTDMSGVGLSRSAGVSEIVEAVRCQFEMLTWQAFWRTTVDGESPADVARDLNISCNAVYLARSRVLKKLRESVGLPTGGKPSGDD